MKGRIKQSLVCSVLVTVGLTVGSGTQAAELAPLATDAAGGSDVISRNGSGLAAPGHLRGAEEAWVKPLQLRCWQDGRLIIEENNWHIGQWPKSKEGLQLTNSGDEKLYLFNLNRTFCAYRGGKS